MGWPVKGPYQKTKIDKVAFSTFIVSEFSRATKKFVFPFAKEISQYFAC